MSKNTERIIHKVRMYENLVWLGLLFYPCAFVFAILASSTAGMIRFEDHTEKQLEVIHDTKVSNTIAIVAITLIWIVIGFIASQTIFRSK